MSKLINDPTDAIRNYLTGLAATQQRLHVDTQRRVIFRNPPAAPNKVALISGGGSGHEPLHSGFVGTGMLDAACVGEVFSSATPGQITHAIEQCTGPAGALLIVKNYMGDQMNFAIAHERALANGLDVRFLTIDDDVASGSARSDGRRGVGLTVLAEKILGAAAEAGMTLDEIQQLGESLRTRSRSMGIATSSCVFPGASGPTFEIGENEIEVGIGIHGEPGSRRQASGSAEELASIMVDSILDDLEPPPGCSFVALVNGMGGTPQIELYVMASEIEKCLSSRGHEVDRYLVGSYITSLEMAGCSLTLLVSDDTIIDLWDAPVETPALSWRN